VYDEVYVSKKVSFNREKNRDVRVWKSTFHSKFR